MDDFEAQPGFEGGGAIPTQLEEVRGGYLKLLTGGESLKNEHEVNYRSAKELFHKSCTNVTEAEGVLYGNFRGADVRLYPPKMNLARRRPEMALPQLHLNINVSNTFHELIALFEEADIKFRAGASQEYRDDIPEKYRG